MVQVPALRITVADETTGMMYTDSIHRIVGVNIDALESKCTVQMGIYLSEEALQEGKKPIVYNGEGRPFYLIYLDSAAFAAALGSPITTEEKALNLAPPAYTALRIVTYLKTLSDVGAHNFNFADDAEQILVTI
jgi:hypothetical protein